MKICIFPNDPILKYFKKGEIKDRFFNPNNFFDEVHIISFIEKDIEEERIKKLAGNAKLKIHSVGKINLINYIKNKQKILKLVKSINPDIIRAYNPLLQGWFAVVCSKELKIPFFLSLHTQFDRNRDIMKKTNIKKFLALKYTEKFIEPYVLKNADIITIVYKIIEPYVVKHTKKKPELVYNKIDFKIFDNAESIDILPKPLIISVGNLIKEKNHLCLINAMKMINAYCLIIGNGKQYKKLQRIIQKEKLGDKIIIKKSVPHEEIQSYYKSADIFALAYDPELEGLPIPILEAMAAGLPVVIPYPKLGYSDGLEEIAIFSKRDPSSFAIRINQLLKNKELHSKFSIISKNKAKEFDISIVEKKEADIYAKLVK